ncbi:hypothetical protein [Saccharopolyspora spinosa]|uniref:Uncharacterized protein n=1 Tax=Saccharopolyspora spinosa TaxID=60894 RepID=A0A2N3XV99_SACSN|nr:hypothetical protein [Saccharopolyspora spinosa]PKW14579.1 hypothetical protein A8926_2206 [Saccharopolyspora spinosa]
MGTSAIGSLESRRLNPRAAIITGSPILPILLVGLLGTLAALAATSVPLFFASLVITGFGFGGAFLGDFGSASGSPNPTGVQPFSRRSTRSTTRPSASLQWRRESP